MPYRPKVTVDFALEPKIAAYIGEWRPLERGEELVDTAERPDLLEVARLVGTIINKLGGKLETVERAWHSGPDGDVGRSSVRVSRDPELLLSGETSYGEHFDSIAFSHIVQADPLGPTEQVSTHSLLYNLYDTDDGLTVVTGSNTLSVMGYGSRAPSYHVGLENYEGIPTPEIQALTTFVRNLV